MAMLNLNIWLTFDTHEKKIKITSTYIHLILATI